MHLPAKPSLITFLLWTAVLIWMVLIFTLSAQQAPQSSTLSGETIRKVVAITNPDFGKLPAVKQNSIVESYQYVARKAAHTLAYLVLGVLTMSALFRYRRRNGWRFGTALTACVGYAGTDEIHQLFVAGRSGQISDVGIDACGALLGISFVLLAHWLWGRKRRSKQSA